MDPLSDVMGRLSDRKKAVSLIQGRLGCGCPREVFEHYRIKRMARLSLPMIRIILGERLLVWILEASQVAGREPIIPKLLEAGAGERDRQGLNRFRLVLMDPRDREEREHLMQSSVPPDEKVHLHVIEATDFS